MWWSRLDHGSARRRRRANPQGALSSAQVALSSRPRLSFSPKSWSARSWTTFAAQKISVALHYAAAFEISMALRVPKFDQAELDAAAARRMAGGG